MLNITLNEQYEDQNFNGYTNYTPARRGRNTEPTLQEMLLFAEPIARRWFKGWGYSTVNSDDIEDLWAETQIAILHFKLPEEACEWKPLMVGFMKKVCWRIYRRYTCRAPHHTALEELPECFHPNSEMESLDDETGITRQVAERLLKLPTMQAAAILFHLDCDLARLVLDQGGESLKAHLGLDTATIYRLLCQSPCPDSILAEAYQTTGRALIAARQNARKRLQKHLGNWA